jgi:hypothetical protein
MAFPGSKRWLLPGLVHGVEAFFFVDLTAESKAFGADGCAWTWQVFAAGVGAAQRSR